MKNEMLNAVGHVGDGLIDGAEENESARYFREKRKKKIRWCSGILAAALCLSAAVCVPLFFRRGEKNPAGHNPAARQGYAEAFRAERVAAKEAVPGKYVEEKEQTELQGKLVWRLESERNVYAAGEQPTFTLKYGLTDTLGDGTLRITVETGDFSAVGAAETVTEHFTYPEYAGADACEMTFSLQTEKTEGNGILRVLFSFEREGEERTSDAAATWQYLIHDNELFFAHESVFDAYELRLEKLLADQVISEQEFAETWYALQYRDDVSVTVPLVTKEGRICISYFSKNIRYESGKIFNETISELWEEYRADYCSSREKAEKLAKAELDFLLSIQIITEKEYQKELDWIREVKRVQSGEIGLGCMYSEEARKVLEKYRYTH